MRHDEEPYTGPIVVIRLVAENTFEVGIEPPIPGVDCPSRQFPAKCEAYAAAHGLWTQHRLGCRDELVGNTGRMRSE
jgi:hypothetical protein